MTSQIYGGDVTVCYKIMSTDYHPICSVISKFILCKCDMNVCCTDDKAGSIC